MSASLLVLVIAAAQAAIAIPLVLGVVPPNAYYGLRTPKTRSDEARWYSANRFFAASLLLASAVSISLALARPDPGEPTGLTLLPLLVPTGLATAASLVYVWRMP